MHRDEFLKTIVSYHKLWVDAPSPHATFDRREEEEILNVFREFVASTPACFERDWQAGHVTASALVVSPDLDQVLLTLHGKLNLWLQLGGHVDGNPRPHEAARREVEEESGLKDIAFLDYETRLAREGGRRAVPARPQPFDFDYHHIPARKTEPAHIHYDVRYLIVADAQTPLVISDESHDLRWFTLAEARTVTDERSMHRLYDKLEWLKAKILQ